MTDFHAKVTDLLSKSFPTKAQVTSRNSHSWVDYNGITAEEAADLFLSDLEDFIVAVVQRNCCE